MTALSYRATKGRASLDLTRALANLRRPER